MPQKLIRYILLAIFVSFTIFGFIHPEGIPAAVKNNAWSLSFIKKNQEGSAFLIDTNSPPPTHLHSGLLLAHQALKQDETDVALASLAPLIAPKDRLALETFADILFLQKDYANAINLWGYLGHWFTLEQASRVLTAEGDVDSLILAHRSAYELFPERYGIHLLRSMRTKANQLINQDQVKDAIAVYQEMLTYFPTEASIYIDLAWTYVMNEQPDLADHTLAQGLVYYPEDAEYYNEAADIYLQIEQPEKALEAYQRALEIDPNSSTARQGIEFLSDNND